MMESMCLSARRELLISVRQKYHKAGWQEKGKILDGFVAATDYDRKYATRLLNGVVGNLFRLGRQLTRAVHYREFRSRAFCAW